MNSGSEIWVQVIAALHLLKTDPAGLKGAVFRVRTGPVRDSLAKEIRKVAGPVTRLHPNMSEIIILQHLTAHFVTVRMAVCKNYDGSK